MAKTVREIMNPELLSVRSDDPAERALGYILAFNITAAPVLDHEGRAQGVVSLRDLQNKDPQTSVADCMTTPAATIPESESVDLAGQRLVDQGLHHLVVVNSAERAVGMVSALDVLSATIGRPVRHPAPFPHYDKALDVFWTDDMLLDSASLDSVPNGPGVMALVAGGQHRTETVVWAEAVHNLPARLADLTARPQTENKSLMRLLERETNLRVRAAHIPALDKRESVARTLMQQVKSAWAPHGLG